MPFSFHNDHFYIFHAKFLSTGVATPCESWDNTYYVYISLCFIFDVLIPGLLKMTQHPILCSSNVVIMKVLFKSGENKYGNNISSNPQVFAYKIIFDSGNMNLIILYNSVEFVQKFQAPYFQICAINISKNSRMYAYGKIHNSLIMNHNILYSSIEFEQKLQAPLFSIYKDFLLLYTLLCCSS